MVRFGLHPKAAPLRGNHHSDALPTPPYREDDVPAIVGGTTTVVPTTASQTTTHFFSLPLWKRRHPALDPLTRRSISGTDPDEAGTMIRPFDSLKSAIDKALPPIPTSDENSVPDANTTHDADHSPEANPSHRPLSSFTIPTAKSPPRPSSSKTTPPPTVALAHAALGLGLPHVMPQASASTSLSESSIASLSPERTPTERRPGLKRSKSSQKLPPSAAETSHYEPSGFNRQRGISLGESNGSSPSAKGKGKEVALDTPSEVTPLRKGISRRPSFWNRKRHDSSKNTPADEVNTSLLPTTLPSLPPVSPFQMDTNMSSASGSSQSEREASPSPPGLIRRYSDRRTAHASPTIPPSSMQLPATPHRTRRPSTAGGVLERPRAPSLYIDSSTTPVIDSPPPMSALPPPKSFPAPAPDEPPTTPPRQPLAPAQTPLLRRLSVNLLSFASSSTTAPSPTMDKTHVNIPSAHSPNSSSPRPSISRPSVPPPKPNVDEESPQEYLSRVLEAVSKADVATVLASSGDEFHTRALRAYLSNFEFGDDPLDVAIRRLLMYIGLPRETQQIDRVMEAFAARYREDHVDLYISDDHPYILAFSLIMLHTDAFNKSNKRKMTKADYVKNTRLPGVPPEVLDCFYDNIIFAPFIFIEEDQLEAAGQRGIQAEAPSRHLTGLGAPTGMAASSISLLGKTNKVDPYYLITNNLLDPLRVNIEAYVSLENPYSYRGSQGLWNEEELRGAFARAGIIEVSPEQRRMSTPFFALGVTGFPSPYPGLHGTPDHGHAANEDVSLKVTKVGLLHRRDIVLEGGKRVSSRKWRTWSVILTGSQLLLFRDPVWASHLSEQMGAGATQLFLPPASLLKPDEIFTVKDAVAVYDKSYDKTDNTFILILHDGRHLLLQATDETDMNQWISRINYASAFKTVGIRMRPLAISGKDVQLMGVAAAASHLRDLKAPKMTALSPRVRTWDNRSSAEFVDRPVFSSSPPPAPAIPRSMKTVSNVPQIAFEVPTAPAIDGAQQFKATFDQVKADLAAGRTPSMDDYTSKPEGRPRAVSLESAVQAWPTSPDESESKPSSRTELVRSKIQALDTRIETLRPQLDGDLRLIRNIGILTPFQRATRDRLEVVVQTAARRIVLVRLELEKLICHREVLAHDLAAEVRDWHRTKSLALRAATETLQKRREASGAPRMTLSLHLDSPSPLTPSLTSNLEHMHNRPLSSSTSASFHSALDHSWPNTATPNRMFEGAVMSDSPLGTPMTDEGPLGSSSSYSFHAGESPNTTRTDSTLSLQPPQDPAESAPESSEDLTHGHERFVTAKESPEEAEEWNKTRAAKRVSLVKVPSDLRLSRAQTRSPEPRRGIPTGKVSRSPIPFFSEASYISSNLR